MQITSVSVKLINSHLCINYLNRICTFQSLRFQRCDYNAEEQGRLEKLAMKEGSR